MTLDFIFHGGANLNAKMTHTADFDGFCREVFERWHLRIEGNTYFKEGRFLEMPVEEANARLVIRTFWVKESGARAECYYLGVKLTRDAYREAGDYYRLVSALRTISLERIREFVSNRQKLDLALTVPMRRQSMWKGFGELSGTRMIGAERFDENLEHVLLAVSINNIDDWFNRLWLAIDPAVDHWEFNVVVSRMPPKDYGKGPDPVVTQTHMIEQDRQSSPRMFNMTSLGTLSVGLFCGATIGLLCGVAIGRNQKLRPDIGLDCKEKIKEAYESGRKLGYDEGRSVGFKEASTSDKESCGVPILSFVKTELDKTASITNCVEGKTE